MNIKEHIEANHYPTDDKGRALVPMKCGLIATIATTDKPGTHPIIGWYDDGDPECWQPDGAFLSRAGYSNDLVPPPPRKVKVNGWAIVRRFDGEWVSTVRSGDEVGALGTYPPSQYRVVTLTGEYEQGWDDDAR